ncbi:MAG: hypothetical protein KDE69_14460, partial [Burkholderiaceae bacterium]|nr:hypothetical protein [Burkholderiaceae bacterium]
MVGAAAWIVLAACGGGSDDGPGVVQPPANPAGRGQLLASSPLGAIAPAEIAAALAQDGSHVQGVVPRYSVVSWRLEYTTLDANGGEVRASGLISVPQKPAGSASPVLSYQHGTIFRDAEAPSNNAVPGEVSVVLASLGYVVVAPDYVGFGASRGTLHPYLLSAPTAAAVVDLLTASKVWR